MGDRERLEMGDSVPALNFSKWNRYNINPKYVWMALTGVVFVLLIVIVVQASGSDGCQQAKPIDVNTNKAITDTNKAITDTNKANSDINKAPEASALKSNEFISPQLYVFGGYSNSDNNKFLNSASHFNSSKQRWEPLNKMPTPRAHFCGAAVGTKIYLFGGVSDTNTRLETSIVYDTETGTYTPYRSMYRPLNSCAAAVLDGFIYVAGGWDGKEGVTDVIRYNINTTRRETVASLHSARDSLQMVNLRGRLYAFGGKDLETVEMYNPRTDQWSMVANAKFKHHDFGATVHEGKIYACGHEGFEVYDPNFDKWTALPPINSREGKALVSMNGQLLALGGGDDKSVYTYNTYTGKWKQLPDMDIARKFHMAFVVNH